MGNMSHDKAVAKKASCLPVLDEMGSARAYGKWSEWTRVRNEEEEGWEDSEVVRGLRFRKTEDETPHAMSKASATGCLQKPGPGSPGVSWALSL